MFGLLPHHSPSHRRSPPPPPLPHLRSPPCLFPFQSRILYLVQRMLALLHHHSPPSHYRLWLAVHVRHSPPSCHLCHRRFPPMLISISKSPTPFGSCFPLERQVAAIRDVRDVEVEHLLTELRLLRWYLSKEQLQTPVLQFFEEILSNLSIVNDKENKQFEVRWNDKDNRLSI